MSLFSTYSIDTLRVWWLQAAKKEKEGDTFFPFDSGVVPIDQSTRQAVHLHTKKRRGSPWFFFTWPGTAHLNLLTQFTIELMVTTMYEYLRFSSLNTSVGTLKHRKITNDWIGRWFDLIFAIAGPLPMKNWTHFYDLPILSDLVSPSATCSTQVSACCPLSRPFSK